jgi:hypothetical protein
MSSWAVLAVGDDETGLSLKRISTNGRAEDVFRAFDCRGKVIGAVVDVAAMVVVVVDEVETTIRSVGGLVWFTLLKSFLPRLANGSISD